MWSDLRLLTVLKPGQTINDVVEEILREALDERADLLDVLREIARSLRDPGLQGAPP